MASLWRHSLGVGVLAFGLLAGCGEENSTISSPSEPAPPTALAACADLRGDDDSVDGELSNDTEIAVAQQWRAEFGLPSSIAAVEVARTATTSIPEAGAFEYPLTDQEAQLLFGRTGPEMELLQAYADEHVDVFAGVWIDNPASGIATIGVTDDTSEHEDALRARNGGSLDGIRVVRQERTAAELERLQEEVTSRLAGRFSSVGIAVDLNMVSVSLPEPDSDAEAILGELAVDSSVCFDGYHRLEPVVGDSLVGNVGEGS